MADFGPDRVFFPNFQVAISQGPLQVRSGNFQSFHISMIYTNKWCKNEKILRGKGVMPWMVSHGIAPDLHKILQKFIFY